MESYILISYLNDFIFCPRSIYFHKLYDNYNTRMFHGQYQVAGNLAHATIDNNTYSTKKSVLQGIDVFSEQYNLYGKIDTFNVDTGELTERKKKIKTIYDGYIVQLYAQYFCLEEMEYSVHSISLYSMEDNKKYHIALPQDDTTMKAKFEQVVHDIACFTLDDPFTANPQKCKNCIYANLCDKAEAYDDGTRL